MDISTAPAVEEADDRECNICEAEGTFVIYDGDQVCTQCGHAPTSDSNTGVEQGSNEWSDWFDHRDERYSGWYGEDRIKFPGGFASAYDFGSDF